MEYGRAMKSLSEQDDVGSGGEMPAAQASERFYLVLTGTLMYGFEWEDVVEELSHLLRLSRSQASSMLQGNASRIRVALNRKKVEHLQGKVIACGAGCMIESLNPPASVAAGSGAETAAGDGGSATVGVESEMVPVVGAPSRDPKTTGSMNTVTRDASAAAAPVWNPRVELKAETRSVVPANRRFRRRQWIAAALLLSGIISWGGIQLLSPGESPIPGKAPLEEKVKPKLPPPPESRTRERMQKLGRQVRVWMVQYGGGFDPYQATLERTHQDLQLTEAELQDGWGTRMGYQAEEKRFILTSAGPDREFATEDDLRQSFKVE